MFLSQSLCLISENSCYKNVRFWKKYSWTTSSNTYIDNDHNIHSTLIVYDNIFVLSYALNENVKAIYFSFLRTQLLKLNITPVINYILKLNK